jgi:hypothetical protein
MKFIKDLLAFGRDMNAVSLQTERERRQTSSAVGNKTDNLWLARASFPIYLEHMNLPAGSKLVGLTKTPSGVRRTIALPAWDTRTLPLRDIRRNHAKWTDGGISEEMVRVRTDGANARLIHSTQRTPVRSSARLPQFLRSPRPGYR